MNHAAYLSKNFDYKEQSEVIKQKQLKFDAILVTGVSGIIMGSIVARLLRKHLTIVRKSNDGSHSTYFVENFRANSSYIFLDDLIASGETYYNVKKSFDACKDKRFLYGYTKNVKKQSKIVGAILYDPTDNDYVEFRTTQSLNDKIKKFN
jgi:orotate phosphoribosyltransferase-like protein